MSTRSEHDGKDRDVQPGYYFAMSCLLYSRVDPITPGGPDPFTTDVHGYLDNLHHAVLAADPIENEKRLLTRHDADVLNRIRTTARGRLRYTLYRAADDALVTSAGLFQMPLDLAALSRKEGRGSQGVEEARMGRGHGYYHFTFVFAQQLPSLRENIAGVLERLSVGFDKYLKILSHMRGGSADIADRLAVADIEHFERNVNDEMLRRELQQKQDAFLDLYGEWKRTGARYLEEQLRTLANEIRLLNPSFTFDSLR